MASQNEICIILAGQTGHGKSSTGNSILGKNVFTVKQSSTSVTTRVQLEHAERWGKHIVIADCPGYFDTKKDNAYIEKQILSTIVATYPGFKAILFVIKAERITKEVRKTIDLMMNSFGAQAADFAYVVLTNIKNEERKGEYLSSPEPKLKEIMALCKGKVLFIDNEAEPKRVEEMAKNIIQAIVKESQFDYYKHECFSQVAQLMKKMGKKEADIQNVDRRKEMVEDDGFLSSLMGFVKKLAPIAGVISPLAGVIGTAVSSIASMFSK